MDSNTKECGLTPNLMLSDELIVQMATAEFLTEYSFELSDICICIGKKIQNYDKGKLYILRSYIILHNSYIVITVI